MTNQEIEDKFNLILDPVVRQVVKHLYTPNFDPVGVLYARNASEVLNFSFFWDIENEKICPYFWNDISEKLKKNSNYTFNENELLHLREAYPELFLTESKEVK